MNGITRGGSTRKPLRGQRTTLAWVVAGFVCINVWFYLIGYGSAFDALGGPQDGSAVGRYGFFAACLASAVLFSTCRMAVERLRTSLNVAVPLLLVIGTGLYGVAPYQTLAPPDVLACIGSPLIGLGYLYSVMSLYHALALSGTSKDVIVSLVAVGVLDTVLFSSAISFVPAPWQVPIAMAAAVLSSVSIALARRSMSRRCDGEAMPDAAPGSPDDFDFAAAPLGPGMARWQQIGQLALVSIVLIVMRGLADSGLWGNAPSSPALAVDASPLVSALAISALFAVISLPTFLVYLSRPGGYRCHLPFLVLIAGFLALVLLRDHLGGAVVEYVLENALELLCQVLFSFTIVTSARLLRVSGFRLSGLTLAFSYALVLLWSFLLEGADYVSNSIILGVTYLLVVFVATPVLPGRRRAGGENVEGARGGVFDGVVAKSQEIARERGLTMRETEILGLLAQGRSMPYIQQELVLAEGTVRTHVNRIYKKLDVHSRQELIDLLIS